MFEELSENWHTVGNFLAKICGSCISKYSYSFIILNIYNVYIGALNVKKICIGQVH
jgi:hypothetical protein